MERSSLTPVETSAEQLLEAGWQPGEWEDPKSVQQPGWLIRCYQRRRCWRHAQHEFAVMEFSSPWVEVSLDGMAIIPPSAMEQICENVEKDLGLLREGLEFLQRAIDGRCDWDLPELDALANWIARHARTEWTDQLRVACGESGLGRLILANLPPRSAAACSAD